MQFLWLYVDDLMGKGLEWNIILELLLYASANWVPLALPLSVLLASIMAFGSLGEKNELLALKSAGISLFKIMRPLIVVIMIIAAFAFYFTNNLWPVANFKMRVLLRDIQNTKVALVLQPGVFFKSEDFAIRIGSKNKKVLLRHFGGIESLRKASIDQIKSIQGIGSMRAKLIYDHFNGQ